MQAFVESKGESASNITACIKPSTIENLHGAARPTKKSTYLDLKWRKASSGSIPLDAPTVRASIKLTLPTAHSGNIISTKSSTARNMPNYVKTARNQFVHLWTSAKYDLQRYQKILSQNICKNSLLINTILEVNSFFDIIFIQEPSWSSIHSIPSSSTMKEIPLLVWLTILIG